MVVQLVPLGPGALLQGARGLRAEKPSHSARTWTIRVTWSYLVEVTDHLTWQGVLGRIAAVLALVALNGFFVAAEFALVGARRSKLQEMLGLLEALKNEREGGQG